MNNYESSYAYIYFISFKFYRVIQLLHVMLQTFKSYFNKERKKERESIRCNI